MQGKNNFLTGYSTKNLKMYENFIYSKPKTQSMHNVIIIYNEDKSRLLEIKNSDSESDILTTKFLYK
jgi:hypothetical protein